MVRHDGRATNQLRPVRITPHFTNQPDGSVLIEVGETRVMCTATIDDSTPSWLRNAKPPKGWLTAEYNMLPAATGQRTRRERSKVGGRTQEIQRLIARSLRGAVDLKKMPEMQIIIDCDVLQADGGTRTASITGGMVALKIAVNKALADGRLKKNPIIKDVAAISIGIKQDELLLDLDYIEDSSADLDMNVVMTSDGKFLEVQGTGEHDAFSAEQVQGALALAQSCREELVSLQNQAGSGELAEL